MPVRKKAPEDLTAKKTLALEVIRRLILDKDLLKILRMLQNIHLRFFLFRLKFCLLILSLFYSPSIIKILYLKHLR